MVNKSQEREDFSFKTKLGKEYIRLRTLSLRLGTSKSMSISYATNYIRNRKFSSTLKVADFGCLDGEFLSLFKDMSPIKEIDLHGFDYNESLLELGRSNVPEIVYHNRNLFSDDFKDFKNTFDIGFCVNTLHEIYSFYSQNGEFNHQKGIDAVIKSIENMKETIKEDGILVIFDGVDSIHRNKVIRIRLKTKEALNSFYKFFEEYKFNKISFKKITDDTFDIKYSTFTKFITKHRFLNNIVWEIESEECYQYFTPDEFRSTLEILGTEVEELALFSPNTGKWTEVVEILNSKFNFPDEHILIIGKK